MIACFAARVVEIAQRRACKHPTSIIIIGARAIRRPRIRCRGGGTERHAARVMCAHRAPRKVSSRLRQYFDSTSRCRVTPVYGERCRVRSLAFALIDAPH